MKKIIIAALLLIGVSGIGKAQNLNVNYQMTFPSGDVKDFTTGSSFRGFDLNYHYFVTSEEHLSFGIDIAWNVFYKDKEDVTGNFMFHNDDNIYTITGNQYRYVNFVPMLAQCRYTFMNNMALVRPYVGFGVGTSWCEKRTEIGQFRVNDSKWQFAMSPEVGITINASQQIGFNIGAKYMYATKAGNGKIPQISQFTVSVGIVVFGVE